MKVDSRNIRFGVSYSTLEVAYLEGNNILPTNLKSWGIFIQPEIRGGDFISGNKLSFGYSKFSGTFGDKLEQEMKDGNHFAFFESKLYLKQNIGKGINVGLDSGFRGMVPFDNQMKITYGFVAIFPILAAVFPENTSFSLGNQSRDNIVKEFFKGIGTSIIFPYLMSKYIKKNNDDDTDEDIQNEIYFGVNLNYKF